MQDDPPEDTEDEFDGMLDDAPSTGPHMPEDDDESATLDDASTTPDNPHGCCPGCMMSIHSPPPNPYGDKKGGNE